MSPQTYETIEAPSGSGELRKAGLHLANVFFYLEVRPAGDRPGTTAAAPAETQELWDISGTVSISQDEPNQPKIAKIMLSGDVLMLHLGDGRRLGVRATPGDAFSGDYHVAATGRAGFLAG